MAAEVEVGHIITVNTREPEEQAVQAVEEMLEKLVQMEPVAVAVEVDEMSVKAPHPLKKVAPVPLSSHLADWRCNHGLYHLQRKKRDKPDCGG